MADNKEVPMSEKPKLTWADKLDQGKALNHLDEAKADADFNFKMRKREKEERDRFEKLKASGRIPTAEDFFGEDEQDEEIDTSSNNSSSSDNSKKGK